MKLEALQTICSNLGYTLIQDKENTAFYYIDDLFIYETDKPVLVRGIISRPHPDKKTWMVGGTSYIPGDRDTPDSSDVYDIAEYNSLEIGVKQILIILETRKVERLFEVQNEDELDIYA